MKRLICLVILGLLAVSTRVLAYDGPAPLIYDQTIDTVRVELTSQSKIFFRGYSKFTIAARVVISAANVGQAISVQLRQYVPDGDVTIYSCLFTPTAAEVGTTAIYNCDSFEAVPVATPTTTSVQVYPYVLVNATNPAAAHEHNGQAQMLTLPIVGDDIYEDNDWPPGAMDLGTINTGSPQSKPELVWLDTDMFKFTVGPGAGSAEISIRFWHEAADLDLWIYNGVGDFINLSASSEDDEERVNIAVTPGQTYYVEVQPSDPSPAFYDMTVAVNAPDIVTITSGPSGMPNPVASEGSVNLVFGAVDSLGHTLSYSWSQSCPALPSVGTFSSRYVQQPVWTAPPNLTGVAATCSLKVDISDGAGVTIQASFGETVNPVGHGITITSGPAGTPNPAASAGAVTLSVSAMDTLGHSLNYAWQATCQGGLGNGSFSPNATASAPTWTAPANTTGTNWSCTIALTVDDGQGLIASNSYSQIVNSVPDTVTITSGPNGTPDPVASGGTITLSVAAVDSITGPPAHVVSYAWSASCNGGLGNGSFSNGASQNPTWTAPSNATGSQHSCTLSVTASDGVGHGDTKAFTAHVESVADTVTITAGPTATADPVTSEGGVSLSVTANDTIVGHALSYAWSASCPTLASNGSFSNATATPTWTAPANTTGTQQTCTVSVTVSDNFTHSASASTSVHVDSVADAVTMTAAAAGTPNPVASQGAVALTVGASDSITGHVLTYSWTASCNGGNGNGSFSGGTTPIPTWTAPANPTGSPQWCSIDVTADDGHGHTASSHHVQFVLPHLTMTSGPSGTPNPVATGGTANLSASASDSLGHTLSYSWQASCPAALGGNGAFAPSASVQNPTWQAPANATGSMQTCTIGVTVNDGQGVTATGNFDQHVGPSHSLTISQQPSGTPNAVASGVTASLSVGATDSLGHALGYAWTATCPAALGGNGSFSNAAASSTSWTAPANLTGSTQSCTIQVSVNDGANGLSQSASYVHNVTSVAHTLTFTQAPAGTPSFAQGEAAVALNALASDSLNHAVSYQWSVSCAAALGSNGTFSNAAIATPTWTAPANPTTSDQTCTISVTASDGQGQTQTASFTPTITAGSSQPTEFLSYFAEGATVGGFFETRFALLALDNDATVSIEFQLKNTTTVLPYQLTIPAHTRRTIDVNTLGALEPALAVLALAEFSTVVRSNAPLVADRTMTWDQSGYGSHAETAVTAPASTWYLAEGATIGNFDLYYLIQNPNPEPIAYTVTYLLGSGGPIQRTYTIGANTRDNIHVNEEPGLEDAEVSAIIEAPADKPIIVERAMYLSTPSLFWAAGHESAGITAPADKWFFAEGATGDFFDLFILIGNPNATTATVTATFLFDDGTTCSTQAPVGPKSRYNIWVDATVIPGCPRSLASADVSTTITSDIPVVAERTMWWPGPTAGTWSEAHNAAGATTTGTKWGLAGGEQGGPRNTETYILIANTSATAGTAQVTLYFEDGSPPAQAQLLLAPNSRTSVPVGATFAVAAGKRFGTVIESLPVSGPGTAAQIVVERAMYSNGPGAPFWAAGTDVLATRLQ